MAKTNDGRPKRKAKWREPFQVRMDDGEKAVMVEAAAIKGVDTSTWMRMVCLDAAKKILEGAKKKAA